MQQYGQAGAEYEILVQLPGVDDPARVKELIGTAAVLEIDEVKEGPFASQEAADRAARRRAAAEHQAGAGQSARRQRRREWYLVGEDAGRVAAAKCATRAPARMNSASGKPISACRQDGGKRFGRFTEANIGNRLAVVLDNQIVSVATIQSQDRGFRPHHRSGQRRGGGRSVAIPALRFAAGGREV